MCSKNFVFVEESWPSVLRIAAAKAWFQAIGRDNPLKHRSMFRPSTSECYKDKLPKRRLVKGAVPSIFPHKAIPKQRITWKKKVEKRSQGEVTTIYLSGSVI